MAELGSGGMVGHAPGHRPRRDQVGPTLRAVSDQRGLPGVCRTDPMEGFEGRSPASLEARVAGFIEGCARASAADLEVIVLADRSLYANWLFEGISHLGWHPLLRVNAGGTFRPVGWYHWRPFTHWVPTVNSRWHGRGTAFSAPPT